MSGQFNTSTSGRRITIFFGWAQQLGRYVVCGTGRPLLTGGERFASGGLYNDQRSVIRHWQTVQSDGLPVSHVPENLTAPQSPD